VPNKPAWSSGATQSTTLAELRCASLKKAIGA
jgi:hypothetical protein